ncbi:hypothetical protein EDB83DRAFT_2321398 [Lactarius deliciosus]|nr:hypothetical protein EDB83DRAFT_2321398 [Lactarius deliciosus]
MPTQTDSDEASTTPDVPPIPTPDDDGSYTCDMCLQKVRIGSGGAKNFLQHRGSLGCLRAKKVAKAKVKANQTGKNAITSFFQRVTNTSTTSLAARAPPFTSSPLTPSNLPRRPSVETAQSVNKQTSACPDAHAMALLARLDRAAQNLPLQIPEAEESDDIARVVIGDGPDD